VTVFFDLLHFGDGPQAFNYFVFSFFAILGTLQFVAVRYARHDLLWFEGRFGYALGIGLVVGSFVWFFVTDKEIFIPGLAGGELFTIFVAAFIAAVPVTRLGALVVKAVQAQPVKRAREKEPTL
jgi:hypothetical protein